jgi:hypothetical protein
MSRRDARRTETTAPANAAKTTKATSRVADARTTLAEMKAAKTSLETRLAAAAEERKALAGAALIDKDDAAAKQLADLSAETARITIELENVIAGIAAAQGRLQQAEAREAAMRERENARKANLLLEERQRLAAEAQRSLDDFNRIFAQLIGRGRELRALCHRAPSSAHESLILRSSQQNARCALHRLGLISSEPLPREELRVSLPEMLAHIDAGARRWCDAISDDGNERGAL